MLSGVESRRPGVRITALLTSSCAKYGLPSASAQMRSISPRSFNPRVRPNARDESVVSRRRPAVEPRSCARLGGRVDRRLPVAGGRSLGAPDERPPAPLVARSPSRVTRNVKNSSVAKSAHCKSSTDEHDGESAAAAASAFVAATKGSIACRLGA